MNDKYICEKKNKTVHTSCSIPHTMKVLLTLHDIFFSETANFFLAAKQKNLYAFLKYSIKDLLSYIYVVCIVYLLLQSVWLKPKNQKSETIKEHPFNEKLANSNSLIINCIYVTKDQIS